MKFERTEEYNGKLFLQALDDKRVVRDAEIVITGPRSHPKAWCGHVKSYLQFPKSMRRLGDRYIADVIEVPGSGSRSTFYRAAKGSIRKLGSDEVLG